MTDSRLRDLERRYKETGAPEDGLAWAKEGVRAGDLSAYACVLEGHPGHDLIVDGYRQTGHFFIQSREDGIACYNLPIGDTTEDIFWSGERQVDFFTPQSAEESLPGALRLPGADEVHATLRAILDEKHPQYGMFRSGLHDQFRLDFEHGLLTATKTGGKFLKQRFQNRLDNRFSALEREVAEYLLGAQPQEGDSVYRLLIADDLRVVREIFRREGNLRLETYHYSQPTLAWHTDQMATVRGVRDL